MKDLLARKQLLLSKIEEFEMSGDILRMELAYAAFDIVCEDIEALEKNDKIVA